jgi:hypothetical protein
MYSGHDDPIIPRSFKGGMPSASGAGTLQRSVGRSRVCTVSDLTHDLYKFRTRVLAAMCEALRDHPRSPRRPHNRLAPRREQAVVSFCQRYRTWSSYQVQQRLGIEAPHPHTIQRVRKRSGLARLSKRAPPSLPARRISLYATTGAQDAVHRRPHLGPERIAWDLQNGEGLQISPATIKRLKKAIREALYPPPPSPAWRFYERRHPHSLWHGDFMEQVTLTDLDRTAYQLTLMDDYSRGYVFCDLFLEPDMRTTVHALIVAIRQAGGDSRRRAIRQWSTIEGEALGSML